MSIEEDRCQERELHCYGSAFSCSRSRVRFHAPLDRLRATGG